MAEKEIPPGELSLKYMAWNIKEISECLKKLTDLFEQYMGRSQSARESKERVPF